MVAHQFTAPVIHDSADTDWPFFTIIFTFLSPSFFFFLFFPFLSFHLPVQLLSFPSSPLSFLCLYTCLPVHFWIVVPPFLYFCCATCKSLNHLFRSLTSGTAMQFSQSLLLLSVSWSQFSFCTYYQESCLLPPSWPFGNLILVHSTSFFLIISGTKHRPIIHTVLIYRDAL